MDIFLQRTLKRRGQTHTVLDTVAALPQDIILQVEQLESRKEILDKVADLKRTLVVTKGNRVDSQTGLREY
jgi:hypothetical protein